MEVARQNVIQFRDGDGAGRPDAVSEIDAWKIITCAADNPAN